MFCETCGRMVPCECSFWQARMVLMRGLAGSGKSTLAAKLATENCGAVISADDYFVGEDGVYRHDRSQVRSAHEDARRRIYAAVEDGCRYIVIDNTHITHRDMEEYFRLAARVSADVELVEPTTPWAWDVDECAKRNLHGVPGEIIQSMLARFQPMTSAEAQAVVANMRQDLTHVGEEG
ncbi:MAG: hypothetical protein FD176_167 [Rhodospirillaceae bacterium]|nr:MAG: hypothetical protein FD176_167 [Rhodospirillaceae bacterium]TNC98685.1 MAG: hypothetical protein FD119_156 [Stygiobacter sp.]